MLGKRKRSSKSTSVTKRRKKTYTSSSKQNSNAGSFLIHRGVGFPDKFRTKLQFCDSIALTGFNTSITQYKAFSLSSAYDPDPAIGGGQPTWFDQFASIYNNYQVAGAKMTVIFTKTNNSGVTGDGPYMVGVISQVSNALATTDSPTLCTTPNCQWDVLHEDTNKTVVATYSPKMLNTAGLNNALTVQNASPFYGLVWASPQGSAGTGIVNVVVMIEYIVDFYNLKEVVDL